MWNHIGRSIPIAAPSVWRAKGRAQESEAATAAGYVGAVVAIHERGINLALNLGWNPSRPAEKWGDVIHEKVR